MRRPARPRRVVRHVPRDPRARYFGHPKEQVEAANELKKRITGEDKEA